MSHIPKSLDLMLAAWNETDPSCVRGHLEEALVPDVRFVDPSVDIVGIDAFEANVHQVHADISGATYSRTSNVDEQHGYHRYHWAIRVEGELLLAGFDVTELNSEGRVVKVIGFFGSLNTGVA